MLKHPLFILLLNLLLLTYYKTVRASGPEDYFGQEEADYDYYGDEDFDSYGNIDTHGDLVKDESIKDHLIIASRFIGGIDARGSTITIHDSDKVGVNQDGSYAAVEEEIIESPPEPIPIAPSDIESSDLHESADDGGHHDAGDEEEVFEDVDHANIEEAAVDEIVEESEDSLHPVTVKQVGVKDSFMDKMQGLQMNMDAMVTILKEISGKVGCPHEAAKMKESPKCPSPFIQVNSGECLYMNMEKKLGWTAARFACNKLGADLVYPLHQGQGLGFVMRLVAHMDVPNDTVWVGGSDRQHEGSWRWLNGRTPPNNMAWCPGHPQNLNGREDCMSLSFVKPPGLKASNCLKRKHFVCQKKI